MYVGVDKLCVVEVDVLQVTAVVARVCPRCEACQAAQHVEVATGDGADNLQPTDFAVVTPEAVHPLAAPNQRHVRQSRGQS